MFKLASYDGTNITYDAIGNPLGYIGGLSFTWQNGRELATANKTGTAVSYKYDIGGNFTAKNEYA
jgi:hypothetical protein